MLTTEQNCIPMKDKYKTRQTQVKASFTQVSILINILNWELFVSNDPKSADSFSVLVRIMFLFYPLNPKCMFKLVIDTHSFTQSQCFSVLRHVHCFSFQLPLEMYRHIRFAQHPLAPSPLELLWHPPQHFLHSLLKKQHERERFA